MKKMMILLYGSASYLLFLVAFFYAIGFVAAFGVPKTIDSGTPGPMMEAILVNSLLLSLFAIQHSVMARRGFKKMLARVAPAEIERQTYVIATSIVLLLLYWQWRPMPDVIWRLESSAGVTVMYAICAIGWGIVLLSTLMINHFDLFGVRQTVLAVQGKPYTDLGFRTPGFYKYVRHPIQVGFLIAFWATPMMTAGHLLFAVMTSGYIFVAVKMFEERDLLREHDERYRVYMDQVGGFVPKGAYRGPDEVATPPGD